MADTKEEALDKTKKENDGKEGKAAKFKKWLGMLSVVVVGGILVTVIVVMGKKPLHSLEQAMS
jgi:hypothetical protein